MKNVGAEQRQASNRLASGYRINSAADDAAGLAISETMRAQIRGLDQASRNTQDGQAMINTTEGGLQEVTNILQRVRELGVQAANDTNTLSQREMIREEMYQLHAEVNGMRTRVEFNTIAVLNVTDTANFQVGANSAQLTTFSFAGISTAITSTMDAINAMAVAVGANGGLGGGSVISNLISTGANNIQGALDRVNTERSRLGALSNRLDFTDRSLNISSENLSDAESRVRNTDMAREMMRFTMTNVLQQAAMSMLSQANQLPNNLMQLLR
jgi:flagellin